MLYLVPTPIGNLEDITYRAVNVLKEVGLILAEDTRTAGKLLKHYGIETPTRAFHAHNEHRSVDSVASLLESGMDIALITDAGSPGISDPGYLLVKACIERNIPLTSLPGATAIIPAIVMSGLPAHNFHFEGFLPHKKGRQKRWEQLRELKETLVLYESPHRLMKCLEEAEKYLGPETQVVVCREISKLFEENHRGSISEVIAYFSEHTNKQKGEIVIIFHNG